MLQYKANLAVVSMRYSEFERRVLAWFVDEGPDTAELVLRGGDNHLMLAYLLRDGLVEHTPGFETLYDMIHGQKMPMRESFRLTAMGVDFARRWADAEPLE
ncbi:hypothetical protein [Williamsia muralis]|uniref:hypothetical protein n=1 Tax=Williamsia marianensis TaxID=85044 RepID=UPI000DE6FA46|nr:hypothetical protein [Williamsia marianensis]PVY32287.1 hypothetical protein C7458_10230 [Williamsia marianensis]